MKKILILFITIVLLLTSLPSGLTIGSPVESDLSITVILTVEGDIQTNDPWTTGSTNVNEWAKPMYYIWFDDNGNPEDGRYGNGAGPMSAQVNLDTGMLGLRWYGDDGVWGNSDDYINWPIDQTSPGSGEWSCGPCNISAKLLNDGHSISVTFPLSLIGSPQSLEISAMTSPWTTSALDNTGTGVGTNGWIVISDTSTTDTYLFEDSAAESLTWPAGLTHSELLPNFDIQSLQAIIGGEGPSEPQVRIVSTTSPLVSTDGPVVTVELTNEFNEPLQIDVNTTVTYLTSGQWLWWEDNQIEISPQGTEEVNVVIPYSIYGGTPLKIEWTATFERSQIEYYVTFTDCVMTAMNTVINDSEGYFIIIDNADDYNSTLDIDWENINPQYQDSVVTSSDGKIHLMMLNFSTHHSPLDISLSSVPVVGDIDADSLMGLKGTADTVVGVAQKAGHIKSPFLDKLGVISAGLDFSYTTLRSLDCILTSDNCPEDDWEAFDMFITWTLSAAILGGTAVALLATSPGWAPAGLAVATAASTVSVAYGTAKLLAPLVKEAMEAQADGGYVPEDVSYISTHRSIFMEPDPTDEQMSTGFCDVVAGCTSDTVDYWGSDIALDLIEKYPDQDLDEWNYTGVKTAPLMDYADGEMEGTLLFFELTNEETGDTTISPFIIETEGSMEMVYHGEMPEPTFQYQFNYDINTHQGTLGTPSYVYGQGTQIRIDEPSGNGDLDLHVYVDDLHIGVNYDTGEVENQVPGAWYCGDVDTSIWTEMIVLPEDIDDYRVVINAADAEQSLEDYQFNVLVLDDGLIMAELDEEEQIAQGEMKEFTIHESMQDGEFQIDVAEGGGVGSMIVLMVVIVLAVLIVGILLLRRRRKG